LLAPGTTYFWRVKAVNAAGAGDWSTVWSFTTKPVETPIKPSVPILKAPADKTVNFPLISNIYWQAAERATTYTVQIAKNDGFTEGVIIKEGVVTTYLPLATMGSSTSPAPVPLLAPGATYYWRVKAVNAAGAGSPRRAEASAASSSTRLSGSNRPLAAILAKRPGSRSATASCSTPRRRTQPGTCS
jgi:hypothetical protein